MQGKLTVAFHGEEGIDAGGVTREWYQVITRCCSGDSQEPYHLSLQVASPLP